MTMSGDANVRRQHALEDSAAEFLPEKRNLLSLREAARECRGCPLYRSATQTVFGEGPQSSAIVLVGEQPGDREDEAGRPFVGPAGRLLDQCLQMAGIDRSKVYLTNAVKHFKWEARGKLRLHKKPGTLEVAACKPWLESEIEAIHPEIVVCLGATAAQSLLGRKFLLSKHRGEIILWNGGLPVSATTHPSAILRMPDHASRERETEQLAADLRRAAQFASGKRPLSEKAGR